MLINLIQEGKKEIERALRWQGLEMQVVVNSKEEILSESEQDIKRLNEVFGDIQITRSNIIWR